jgi:hypothetical protein
MSDSLVELDQEQAWPGEQRWKPRREDWLVILGLALPVAWSLFRKQEMKDLETDGAGGSVRRPCGSLPIRQGVREPLRLEVGGGQAMHAEQEGDLAAVVQVVLD